MIPNIRVKRLKIILQHKAVLQTGLAESFTERQNPGNLQASYSPSLHS
jgi:hypothetical protein